MQPNDLKVTYGDKLFDEQRPMNDKPIEADLCKPGASKEPHEPDDELDAQREVEPATPEPALPRSEEPSMDFSPQLIRDILAALASLRDGPGTN